MGKLTNLKKQRDELRAEVKKWQDLFDEARISGGDPGMKYYEMIAHEAKRLEVVYKLVDVEAEINQYNFCIWLACTVGAAVVLSVVSIIFG